MMSMSSTPSSSKVSKNRDESNSMALTHPLATDDISEPTEEKLSDQGTNGSRDLDTEVLVGREGLRARVISVDYKRGVVENNILSGR